MKKTALAVFTACMIILVLLAMGCPNPPSTPTDSDKEKTYTLYSEAAMDGPVVWDFLTQDYTVYPNDVSANIGDWNNATDETITRCFVSFNLSSLPAGAKIKSAVLRMYQNSSNNGDSYSTPPTGLGEVFVAQASYSVFDSTTTSGSNWNAAYGGDTLSTSFSANTWHTFDVTTLLNEELTTYQTGRLQFTLRHVHENNNNNRGDFDGWTMGDSATNKPELVITTK